MALFDAPTKRGMHMSLISSRPAVLAVGAVCAAAGAGAGAIATADASGGTATAAQARTHQVSHAGHRRRARRRGLVRRVVHGTVVLHTREGCQTATINRGSVDSVSGATLTMTDGTRTASYDTQTLTIPASATVRNDRRAASLSALHAGERVLVLQLPTRTIVVAREAKTRS
jgi:hypothetical protein